MTEIESPLRPENPAGQNAPATPLTHLVRWSSSVVLAVAAALVVVLLIGPVLFPYKVLTVLSGSMEPTIHVGSVVVLQQVDASQIQAGEIITFARPDRPSELVTHRVVAVDSGPQGRLFVTRGDANGSNDPWRVDGAGGGLRYLFNIPLLGYLMGGLRSPLGHLLFVIVPAAALGLLLLVEMWWPRAHA